MLDNRAGRSRPQSPLCVWTLPDANRFFQELTQNNGHAGSHPAVFPQQSDPPPIEQVTGNKAPGDPITVVSPTQCLERNFLLSLFLSEMLCSNILAFAA